MLPDSPHNSIPGEFDRVQQENSATESPVDRLEEFKTEVANIVAGQQFEFTRLIKELRVDIIQNIKEIVEHTLRLEPAVLPPEELLSVELRNVLEEYTGTIVAAVRDAIHAGHPLRRVGALPRSASNIDSAARVSRASGSAFESEALPSISGRHRSVQIQNDSLRLGPEDPGDQGLAPTSSQASEVCSVSAASCDGEADPDAPPDDHFEEFQDINASEACTRDPRWSNCNVEAEVIWEWQRSAGTWAPYRSVESQRIDEAFWKGRSMVHVKSGEIGGTPMEIFFADMVQLDPISGRVRAIRRKGCREFPFWKHPWMWTCRHARAIANEIATGKPRFETIQDHKRRERDVVGLPGLLSEGPSDRDSQKFKGITISTNSLQHRYALARRISHSAWFGSLSALMTLLQIVWVIWSLEDAIRESRANMYDAGTYYVVVELGFCVFFAAEFAIRFLALATTTQMLRDGWLCFDGMCVALSILEVVIMPLLAYMGWSGEARARGQAMRVFRIGKIFRFIRLFASFRQFNVVIKGIVFGMRSAAAVWFLLSCLVFAFGLLLYVNVEDETAREAYFTNLGTSMSTILLCGIMFDGIRIFWLALMESGEYVALMSFVLFELVAFFGLLNMLIGLFCHTAMQISHVEANDTDLRFLSVNLKGIIECYLDDHKESMNKEQFQLVMQNMDVYSTLTACGTDVEALMRLEHVLFPNENSELPFRRFFQVILRLRAEQPAHVSHVVSLTTTMEQRFNEVEALLERLSHHEKVHARRSAPMRFMTTNRSL